MKLRERTPDELMDLLAMLGVAEGIFRDLAVQPDTNGLFRRMLERWADQAKAHSEEIAASANEH